MKAYNIIFKTNNLIIPLNYHYQVQSLIYSIIRNGGYDKLHDISDKLKKFKFFTFSLLSGGKFNNNKFIFKSFMKLNVRILDNNICNYFEKGIKLELKFFDQKIELKSLEINNYTFNSNKYLIKTISPINIDRTIDNIRMYYSPSNEKYEELINNNLNEKYETFYQKNTSSSISLKAVGNNKKYVTLYKQNPDIYITGYSGYFLISGDPQLIEFLYYTGIGARNSCGFGCFEIVEEILESA